MNKNNRGNTRPARQRLTAFFLMLSIFATSVCVAATQQTQFQIFDKVTKKKITCGKTGKKWEAGSVPKSTKKFTSFKKQIAEMKLELKDPTLTPKVKNRMTANMQTMKANVQRQDRLCVNAAKATVPDPDATKAAGTPTPKATTDKCEPCNNNGNTVCYGIPSGMTGNYLRGQSAVANCLRCHPSSRVQNLTYGGIQSAFASVVPMQSLKSAYSNAMIADIAAYVNQRNSKQCVSDWR